MSGTKYSRKVTSEAQKRKLIKYWEDRAHAHNNVIDRTVAEVEKDISDAHFRAMAEITARLKAVFGKIADDGQLNLQDVKEALSPKERKEFDAAVTDKIEQFETWIKEADNPETKERLGKYLSEEENLRYLRRVTRLDNMLSNIRFEAAKLGLTEEAAVRKGREDLFEASYRSTNESLSKLVSPAKSTFDNAAKEKWQEDDFSSAIWSNKEDLIKHLRSVIVQAGVSHNGLDDLSFRIMKALGTSRNNARRIVRTEFNNASNLGALRSYKDGGIKKYKFVAAIDSRTSDICEDHNGKIYNVADAQTGLNFPPLHPNCRSVTCAYFDEQDDERYNLDGVELTEEELGALGLSRKDYLDYKKEEKRLSEKEMRKAEDETGSIEAKRKREERKRKIERDTEKAANAVFEKLPVVRQSLDASELLLDTDKPVRAIYDAAVKQLTNTRYVISKMQSEIKSAERQKKVSPPKPSYPRPVGRMKRESKKELVSVMKSQAIEQIDEVAERYNSLLLRFLEIFGIFVPKKRYKHYRFPPNVFDFTLPKNYKEN